MPRPKGAKTRRPDARKTGPREWTPTEREQTKVRVAELDRQGHNQIQIAEKLNVSQATVSVLLKEIRQDYEEAYVDCRKAMVMKATAAHLDVIREAHEQIERLKAKGRRKTTAEKGASPKGPFRKTATIREDADLAGLLSVIADGWKQIARLHGLEELPKQVFNLSVNNHAPNIFDQLLTAMLADEGESALAPRVDVSEETPPLVGTELCQPAHVN